MLREAVATADTVQEAYEKACRELGVETYLAEQEILEMPVKKTLGLFGGSPAKVRAYIKTDPAEKAARYLERIVRAMGVSHVGVKIQEEPGGALLCIEGDHAGFVIGHRGETLDALQYLAALVANHEEEEYCRITLDIGNYREKRRETLTTLGTKIAQKAVKLGRNQTLEPMNPYERRLIHSAVQAVEGAKSWSEGVDLNRHVVIGPEAGERSSNRRRSNNRRGYQRNNHYHRKPPGAPKGRPGGAAGADGGQ